MSVGSNDENVNEDEDVVEALRGLLRGANASVQKKLLSELKAAVQLLEAAEDEDSTDADEPAVDSTDNFVVLVGNAVDGLVLVGPFEGGDVAADYGELVRDEWLTTRLIDPVRYIPEWKDYLAEPYRDEAGGEIA